MIDDGDSAGWHRRLWVEHRHIVGILGVVAALAVPYAVLGPGWFREDHASLANVASGGAFDAAGAIVGRNRPGTWAVYAVVFGPLGDHPAAAFALVVLLIGCTAVLLELLLEPVFGRGPATAVAIGYALSPSQTSITHWASTSNVLIATSLLLAGLLVVQRWGRWLLSGALVALGVLTYEAILPAALAGWSVLFVARRPALRSAAVALLSTAPAVAWVSTTSTNADRYVLRIGDGIRSLFGFGLTGADPAWRLIMTASLAAITLMLLRWLTDRTEPCRGPERMLAAGVVVIVIGWTPFAIFGFGMDFTGQGDRANFIAAIGATLVFVAIGWRATRFVPESRRNLAAVTLTCVALTVVLPTRLVNDRDWAAVWDETRVVLTDANAEVVVGRSLVRIEDCPVTRRGVQGLDTSYSATLALRWWSGDPDVVAACGDDEIIQPRRPLGEGP